MVKRCSWGLCNSDSRYPERLEGNVTFIRFPQPKKDLEKCKRWIKACGRPHQQLNVEVIDGNYTRFVCSKHFVDVSGPTAEFPDPLPVNLTASENDWIKEKRLLAEELRKGLIKTLAEAVQPNSKTPDHASSNVRPVFMCGKEKQDSSTEQKEASDNEHKDGWTGNRLINLGLLLDSLKRCRKCGFGPVPLSCTSVKGEDRVGLGGYLSVQCANPTCQEVNRVAYSRMESRKSADGEKLQYFDVNSKLTKAKIYRLGGRDLVNEVLSTLDLGTICSSSYDNSDLIGGTSTRLTTDPVLDANKEKDDPTQIVSLITAEAGKNEGITSKGGIPMTNGRGAPVYLGGGGTFFIQGGGNTLAPGGGNSPITGGGIPLAQGGGTTISQGSGAPIPQAGGTTLSNGSGTPLSQGGGTTLSNGLGTQLAQGGGTILSQGAPLILGGGAPLILGGAGTALVLGPGGTLMYQGGGTQFPQNVGTQFSQGVGAPLILGSGGSPLILGGGGVGTILSQGGGTPPILGGINQPAQDGGKATSLTLGGGGGTNSIILPRGASLTEKYQATIFSGGRKQGIQKEDEGLKRIRNPKNVTGKKRLRLLETAGIRNKSNSDLDNISADENKQKCDRTEESMSDTTVKCKDIDPKDDEQQPCENSSVESDDGDKVGKSNANDATIKCESVDAEYEQTCERTEKAGLCDTVDGNSEKDEGDEKAGLSETIVKYECVDPEYEKQVIFDRLEDSIADTSVKGEIVGFHYDQQHACIPESTKEGLSYITVKCEVDDPQYEQQHEFRSGTEESDTGQLF